jgi:hypothetical protein
MKINLNFKYIFNFPPLHGAVPEDRVKESTPTYVLLTNINLYFRFIFRFGGGPTLGSDVFLKE